MHSGVVSSVRRAPSRIVPPRCVFDTSGMKTTHGWGVAGSNSVLLASERPSTERAYSTTAICGYTDKEMCN